MATFFIFILVSFVYLMVVVSFFVHGPTLVPIPKANTYAYANQILNGSDTLYGHYTGFSSATLSGNTYANYTIDYTTGETMDFATVFGVFFSSITGLLAGANMSGRRK
jgi:potassium/chloride transporter 9